MRHPRADVARAVWRSIEPVHAVTYFSPEPLSALAAAGYRGFWMGYFAGRAAPLGPAPAELVHALFHNFDLGHVARALPDAWAFAAPEAALRARLDGSVAALRRQLGTAAPVPGVERAAELAERAAAAAPLEGRPLFAANRALPVPDEALARLWHAATLLREHRGDGHVAALTAAGIGGREAHVLHALATGTPAAVYRTARHLTDAEWDAILDGMRQRGLVDPAGHLTERGRAVKERIEETTDDLAAPAYAVLGDDEVDDLLTALAPVRAAIVAAGEIPTRSPMGLDLSD
ncbi:SCO6745 family protein [Nocardioides humi]|uniref:SalK n=1 Tax=Nocardioides humi TaxID=449461 RepID=A0ABN2AVK1_9ACTN|nr:hypothetical protein [Nocardioides humi]